MSDDIIVIGRRPRDSKEYADRITNWVPVSPSFHVIDWITNENNERVPQVYEIDDSGNKIFKFEEFSFEIVIPEADWNRLTANEKKAIVYILQNYHVSPTLKEALQHFHNEQISHILIKTDVVRHFEDGTTASWTVSGVTAAGFVDWNKPNPNDTRDIKAGTAVIINLNASLSPTLDNFSRDFIHELLHPVVPEYTLPGGSTDDHDGPTGVWGSFRFAKLKRSKI
jgi:hypothetical protein